MSNDTIKATLKMEAIGLPINSDYTLGAGQLDILHNALADYTAKLRDAENTLTVLKKPDAVHALRVLRDEVSDLSDILQHGFETTVHGIGQAC